MIESELTPELLAYIRYQEEHPDYWGDKDENDAEFDRLSEILKKLEDGPDYQGDYDENGVDLARLRENLKLTPAERLTKLDEKRLKIKTLAAKMQA